MTGLLKFFGGALDHRQRFYDLRRLPPEKRKPRSPIIQFYSSANNIGNYLPVLGIRDMLGREPDCWCIHDRRLDFDFINSRYRAAIIGGAGLLHSCFTPFWEAFATRCRIPTIIWGVGGCFPDGNARVGVDRAGVDRQLVAQAAGRCDLINVRDELTVNHYGLPKAHVSACPTIVHLRKFKLDRTGNQPVLFSSHEDLIAPEETEQIHRLLREAAPGYLYTDNTQHRRMGIEDILRRRYCGSSLVLTTRLHGAIIAYGLGLPYAGIARDEKLRDFSRLYGNGVMLDDIEQLPGNLANQSARITRPVEMENVLDFGKRARDWLAALNV